MQSGENKQVEVSLEEFYGEVFAMLKVCFEGKVERVEEGLKITLPSGRAFCVSVKEVA